ncbi:MAG: hypothetical protein QXG65_02655 [Thermoplasmata archaeon]
MAASTPGNPPSAGPVPGASPSAPPAPPRTGAYREVGVVRHASLRAARYRLKGEAKILGEVDVGELEVVGLLVVGGRLRVDRARVGGTIEVAGAAEAAESIAVRGTARFAGPLAAPSLSVRGTARARAGLRVPGLLDLDGTAEIVGEAAAGLARLTGRIERIDRLVAREVDGRFEGDGRIGRIEAGTVSLSPRQALRLPVDVPFLAPKATLAVERIDAEKVALEGVEVRYVRAPQIVLGRHCHVTAVEGTVVRRDPTSVVGYESRSPPPPGLFR